MKENKYGFLSMLLASIVLFISACNDNSTEKKIATQSKKDTPVVKEPVVTPAKGPIINITDTLSVKRMVLTMKDSAANMERVGMKLGEIYGAKLGAIIKKYNLKQTGAPVAWYKGPKAPIFFEAGIPVDKKPAKMPPGVYMKQIEADSIVVAHFYGPYNLLPQAYEALGEWIKDHKKKLKGAPYEVYVGDPLDAQGKPKDPYKVQTDVVFSWK